MQVIKTRNNLTRKTYSFLAVFCLIFLAFHIGCKRNDKNAFFDAVNSGNINKIEIMIKDDPTLLSATNADGQTALQLAVGWNNNYEIAKFLLEHGADPNIGKDAEVGSALHIAVWHLRKDTIQLLIEHGADVNAKNIRNIAPLYLAAVAYEFPSDNQYNEQAWLDSLDMLIKAGADVNAKMPEGNSALRQAVRHDSLKAVQLLIQNGADVSGKDSLGNSLYHYAYRNDLIGKGNAKEIMELLVQYGVSE